MSLPSPYSSYPQAIFQSPLLRLESSTLDLLLAALLDNTTGGSNALNGTLESVTYQVGFLGLNSVIANAVSNGTEPNDGLYGPPASAPPPPPPQSGWGAFWNAVTSFVTNPLGTVLSLVDTVWDAATAAFTYLNHLAREAVSIGAEIVARTAAAMVHIGDLIVEALNILLRYIIQLVTDLLRAVTQPIKSAVNGYGRAVEGAVGHAQNDTAANGTLAPGDARAVWIALSGPVFLLALGLMAVVTTALTLLSAIDVGPSFVVGIVITLLIGTLIGIATQALLGSVGAAFSAVSAAAIYALESFFNTTLGQQRPAKGAGIRPAMGGSNQPAWTTAALIVSTCFEFQLAWPLDLMALEEDTKKTTGAAQAIIGGTISLAFDIVGIILFVAGLAEPTPFALLIIGLAISLYSLYGAYGALKQAREAEPVDTNLVNLMQFDIVLQAINLGSAGYAAEQAA